MNDTSEITSAPIRGSQARICYWDCYSLCGTKTKQKVFKSPQTMTVARGRRSARPSPTGERDGSPPGSTPHTGATPITAGSQKHNGAGGRGRCPVFPRKGMNKPFSAQRDRKR
ncbi:hypothetical protein D7M15_10240 [Streptomyces sp. Z26]|nr:hypothetical protein D7M15_10240 [Streptomyces sp. Z26]